MPLSGFYSVNDNLFEQARTVYNEIYQTVNFKESIYSILSIINGSPFASDLFNEEKRGYPLIRIRDLQSCDPIIYTDEVISKMEYVNTGDILIGMDGEFIPYIWFGGAGVLNQRVCKVVPKQDFIHPLFLYFTLRPLLAVIQRTQGGTTVIHIGKKDFDKMQCVSASEYQHRKFFKIASPIYDAILCNFKEIMKLKQAKNITLTTLSR